MSRLLLQHRLLRSPALRVASTRVLAAMMVCVMWMTNVPLAFSATTLLVNNEAFETIDGGDAATNVELRFGATNEKLLWNITKSQFDLTDDLHIDNNLTGSGGLAIEENIRAKGDLTINSDNDSNNASLTFGNTTLAQTLQFMNASQKFRFSTSLDVAGTMSGYALTVSGLRNCNTIDTDANGNMSCGTDEGGNGSGMNQAAADARYLRLAGGTMTGTITNLRLSNLTTSGGVLYSSGSQVHQSAKGQSGQILVSQGTSAPKWATPVGGMIWYFGGTQAVATSKGPQITMPFAVTLSGVVLKAKGAPTGAAYIIDVNKDGSSIFSTRPQIDAAAISGGENAVLSTTVIPANSVLTLDIDQVGSTFAGSGITIMLTGTRKY